MVIARKLILESGEWQAIAFLEGNAGGSKLRPFMFKYFCINI